MASRRGFTLAETIVAIFILGLTFAAIAALAAPIINAPAESAAKSDTVMAAAYGLDTMERDIRQSDIAGVFACTLGTPTTCSQPASLTSAQYVAVMTADNGSEVFQVGGVGGPAWIGYEIYSQPAGSTIIYRSLQTWSALPASWQAGAVDAVNAAAALPAGTTVLVPAAQSLSIDMSTATGLVDLTLVAAATNGSATNSTRYSTTILPRN